jgi:hypothetical protein
MKADDNLTLSHRSAILFIVVWYGRPASLKKLK